MKGTVIFCADGTEKLTAEELREMSRLLPAARRERAARYLRAEDRNNCIAAGFLLLYAVCALYGQGQLPPIVSGACGKPYFAGNAPCCFNLSHTADSVCCAAAEYSIGVDIQSPVRRPESLFGLVTAERETAEILADPCPPMRAAMLWSRKEAYVKYLAGSADEQLRFCDFSGINEARFSFRGLHFLTACTEKTALACCAAEPQFTLHRMQISDYITRFRDLAERGRR